MDFDNVAVAYQTPDYATRGSVTYEPRPIGGQQQAAEGAWLPQGSKPAPAVTLHPPADTPKPEGVRPSSSHDARRHHQPDEGEVKLVAGDRVMTEQEIAREVAQANQKLREMFREFHYQVHRPTNTVVVKIINSGTKEVLKEIPPEKSLDALAKMWQLHGILLDKKL